MKTPRLLQSVLALLLFVLGPVAALHAQATKIFVASFGNDANDGSRGSPKRNFQAAHDATAAGGQIVVLDTAGYGTLNITKSLSVTVPPGVNGFVTAASGNGVTIAAASGDVVALRGLVIEKDGSGIRYGIYATSVGTLVIEDCTVRNFTDGIYVIPTTAMQLSIYNTTVRGGNEGIHIENAAAVKVNASATNCHVEQCAIGGVYAYVASSSGGVDFTLEGCTLRGNSTVLSAAGASVVVRVSDCTISGNANGIVTNNQAQVLSRGNNTLENNGAGNAFPGTYSAQ